MSDGSTFHERRTGDRRVPAAVSAITAGPSTATGPAMVLTLSCPDTTGIVAGVSGFLAANNCLITEAQHFDDPYTVSSFMRTVFRANGQGTPSLADLDRALLKTSVILSA